MAPKRPNESDQQESEETQSPPSSPRPSLDYLRTNIPLNLEHEPPVFRPNPNKSSLFGLHNQISQDRQKRNRNDLSREETSSLASASTDSEYERCMLPFCGALPPPSEDSSTTSASSSSSTTTEPQWLPLVVGRVLSSKARKACRVLREKLSGRSS